MIYKGKLITLKFSLFSVAKGGGQYQLIIRDSYLLLPASLRKLCKYFKVDTSKSIFPFKLSDLWYKGPVPNISLFDSISKEEYTNYKNTFIDLWSFRDESIKYCRYSTGVRNGQVRI